jgi:hypothetical protein
MARKVSVEQLLIGMPVAQVVEGPAVGIEIEIENVQAWPTNPSFQGYWNIIQDGSLRNNGREFVSHPLPLDSVPTALDMFYGAWGRYNYHAHMRCGIHFHFNCRHMMFDDLAGIFATYAIVEPALYQFCGELREENIYCVPWYRSPSEADLIAKALSETKNGYMYARNQLRETCKYSGLYAGPLARLGTIEFRQAPTWEDRQRTLDWFSLTRRVYDYGAARTASEVLDAWHNNPRLMLRQVCGVTPELSSDAMIAKIEEIGCISVAEKFLLRPAVVWNAPTLDTEGDGTDGLALGRKTRIT